MAGSVPQEIYTIPPSNPLYNVTYCYIYQTTPDYVVCGYLPGYVGSYVCHGTVIYGTGWTYTPWCGRYYYAYPATWGFGAAFDSAGGWGLSIGAAFAPAWFDWGRRPYWRSYAPAWRDHSWWGVDGFRSFNQNVGNHTTNHIEVNQNVTNIYNNQTTKNVFARNPKRLVRPQRAVNPQNGNQPRRGQLHQNLNGHPNVHPSRQANGPHAPHGPHSPHGKNHHPGQAASINHPAHHPGNGHHHHHHPLLAQRSNEHRGRGPRNLNHPGNIVLHPNAHPGGPRHGNGHPGRPNFQQRPQRNHRGNKGKDRDAHEERGKKHH